MSRGTTWSDGASSWTVPAQVSKRETEVNACASCTVSLYSVVGEMVKHPTNCFLVSRETTHKFMYTQVDLNALHGILLATKMEWHVRQIQAGDQ